ncbi:PAN/Apple domain [Trinorchestia longiramus]|nr:PAN/Apple domain [Trinorchestia longiramus]
MIHMTMLVIDIMLAMMMHKMMTLIIHPTMTTTYLMMMKAMVFMSTSSYSHDCICTCSVIAASYDTNTALTIPGTAGTLDFGSKNLNMDKNYMNFHLPNDGTWSSYEISLNCDVKLFSRNICIGNRATPGGVEATSEPYGISRDVVAGAALAGASFTPPPSGRDLDARPVPALSQVTPTLSPDGPSSGLEPPGPNPNDGRRPFPDTPDPSTNEISGKNRMNIPLVPEKTACDGGQGEMRFEKLPDVRLAPNSYDSDVIRKNAMPAAVLALCEDRCLKDRTATQQLTRRCGSLDFVPGRRYSSYSNSVEYTETKCFLSQPQDDRNSAGANSRSQYERASNYAHLREVCFSTGASSSTKESILRQECPDRLYVMERLLAKRFTPKNVIEVTASTLEECQNIHLYELSASTNANSLDCSCLHQLSEDPQNETTICRSGTWDRGRNRSERRCPKDRLFYLKEINAEMGGPFDPVTIVNVTLQQCKEKCIESKTIFCRSMEYDQRSKLCVLSDEDSVSRREELRASTSSDNVYFELKCFDGDRIGGEYLMEEDIPLTSPNTEPLNARAFRDVRTAFQLYRNRHLELRSGFRNDRRERNLLTLAECLDECLEERRFACRSVMYSERFQICKLSEFDQYNGELIYDGEYDYFENLMGAGSSGVSTSGTGSSGSGSSSSGSSGFSSSFGSTSFGSSSGSSGSGSSGSSSSGGSSGSFGFSDNRNSVGIGLSGDSFDTREGSGFSSSSSVASTSRTGTRPNRPSLFDDRPGLFRPISTDFGDDSRTSNNRNTGVFGITRGETDGGSSIRGGSSGTSNRFDSSSRFGSSSSSSASSSSDSFGSSADRFGSGSDRVAGGADRFGSGSDRFGSSSDRFGSGSNRFGSSSDRVAGGSDRFGAGSDRFGSSSNSLSGSDSDRTATGLDRFAGTDRFSSAGGGSSASSGLGSSAFGAGRFSGSGSSSDSSTGLFWTGRRGGSTRFDSDRGAASLGADAGSSGLSTSRLGTMNGEGSTRALDFKSGSVASSINFGWGSSTQSSTSVIYTASDDSYAGNSNPFGVFGSSSFGTSSGFSPSSDCYYSSSFAVIERGKKLRHPYIKRYLNVGTREDCSRECLNEQMFLCRGYNFRYGSLHIADNCQLSDRSTNVLDSRNPMHFQPDVEFDFYEIDRSRSFVGDVSDNCPHVAQSCNEDGSMEFTLRTDEPFRGRIYAYGYYDRCFFVGRGSTVSVLQLSSPRGFPDCGTLRYADTLTNIVVVQFAENVQTMMDKRYNLTCTTIGPSDSVVTSAYIGAGYGTAVAGATSSAGAPTPIEYLELENRLDQRVALRVLYDGRPTTTIAVGDPLTFKLEPQAGFNLVSDIFATNVVAKDPYSGRAVQLIDSRGCPVDNYIFPALGRARSGEGLETRFSAFKIPESNFLVFEANVRPCKNACTPAFCRDTHGRGEIESYGRRRRRDLEERLGPVNETSYTNMTSEEQWLLEQEKLEAEEGPMEHVHGIYEVYLSREDIPRAEELMHLLDVCLSPAAYHGLLAITVSSVLGLILVLAATYLFYRRHLRYGLAAKNAMADAANPRHVSLRHEAARGSFPSHPRTVPQPARYFPDPSPSDISFSKPETERRNSCFADPSEPICPNPALFERLPSTGTEPTQQV